MKKVIVFKSGLLPLSETFVVEQTRALTDWTPTFAGYRKINTGLDLTHVQPSWLPGLNAGKLQWLRLRMTQWLGIKHSPTTRAIGEIDAQLIHVHFGPEAVDVWPSVKPLGLPMMVTLHGYDINRHKEWWQAGKGGVRRRAYPRRLLKLAQKPNVHFIAVSEAIKQRAIEYGIPEEKITVSYVGVDTERFQPAGLPLQQRDKRILFVGRMVENKAPLMMIRAYDEIKKEQSDTQLVMIGDGPLLKRAKALADELGVPVDFRGGQPSDVVLEEMHEARVVCLPSVTAASGDAEAFGIVKLEAQACGVPVVTSNIGGAKEGIKHKKNGYCFEAGSTDGLVEGIRYLLADDYTKQFCSEDIAEFARSDFDIRDCTHKLEQIYDRVSCS